MTVWRVTPMRSANCACVISPWAKRSARIELVTLVGLLMAIGLQTPPVGDELHHGSDDRPQHETEVDDIGDPEVVPPGHRHEQCYRGAGDDEPAADVLAEPGDLPVPHVAPVAVAGSRGLDRDPAHHRGD